MAKVLMKGNEAIALAAIRGGVDAFFGYPITPQNEIPELMSTLMPDNGHVFLQAESEVSAINMVYGAAGAGKTTMLQAAAESVQEQGRRLLVISPTKRGALEAGDVLGTDGDSVHALLYRAGAIVDEDTGRWVLPAQWKAQPEAWRMDEHTVLVVDDVGSSPQPHADAFDYGAGHPLPRLHV